MLGLQLAGASLPAGVVHLDLPAISNVTTAAIDYLPTAAGGRPHGILALVPGCNGFGADMLAEKPWVDFARANGFILVAFTFVSKEEDLRDEVGYYDASAGSGAAAASALKKLGAGRIPVFMYGFSGGAHFTSSFAEHFPQLLKGWCAASFEAKERRAKISGDDAKGRRPPGIVACGSEDPRLGATLSYYGRGRAAGRKWTWVELDGLVHERSPALEDFARRYFIYLMGKKGPGVWVDTGSGEDVAHSSASAKTLKTWLPAENFVADWRKLCAVKRDGVIEHVVKTKLKRYEQISLFLRLPQNAQPAGVLCLSLLANSPVEVRERIRSGDVGKSDRLLKFAAERNLAVIAWGSRSLWDPTRNWDELPRADAKRIDSDFDLVANAWDSAVDFFVRKYGIPASGYLMCGASGAAQYAQRLALRRPGRFLAVHVHIASSFDLPVKGGASVLWCVTTGENEMGYARSRKFFRAARDLYYPIIYKAYPGLGHEGNAHTAALGLACFDYALAEQARAMRSSGGKTAQPDWADIFSSAPFVADIFNQAIHSKFDYFSVPLEFRMLLPSELREVWLRE
jgi:hypothetical protein